MIKNAIANYKTTSAGLVMIIGSIVHLAFTWPGNEATWTATITAVLGGIGLILAGDASASAPAVAPTPAAPKPPSPGPVVGILLIGTLLFSGCASLQPGADVLVVRAEQTQVGANATFDFVLTMDNRDRGFWRTNAPAFHQFCEWLRTPTPVHVTNSVPRCVAAEINLQELKVSYKANQSAGNSNALFQATAALGMLVTQANSWSNIVVLPQY